MSGSDSLARQTLRHRENRLRHGVAAGQAAGRDAVVGITRQEGRKGFSLARLGAVDPRPDAAEGPNSIRASNGAFEMSEGEVRKPDMGGAVLLNDLE
ncbi:hypothetical protein D3C72_1902440 [compost metagenome]